MTTTRTRRSVGGSVADDSRLVTRFLVLFFLLAYAISWAWAIPLWPTNYPSLLGPLIAAVIVTAITAGRAGLGGLVSRVGRWRVGLRWWLVAVSPGLLLLLLTLAGLWLAGQDLPAAAEFGRFTGIPLLDLVGLFLVITFVGGLGEEVGWRGYALAQLQRRFSPLAATLLLAPLWFLWHLHQLVFIEAMPGPAYVSFFFQVTAVAVILTWLYNRSGGSVLLVTVWHGMYNFASLTETVAAILVALVMVQGLLLVALEVRARRHGRPSILGGGGESGRDSANEVPIAHRPPPAKPLTPVS